MNVYLIEHDINAKNFDTLVEFYFKDDKSTTNLPGMAGEMVTLLRKNNEFSGKSAEVKTAYINQNDAIIKVVLVGLGNRDEFSLKKLRTAVGHMIKTATKLGSKKLALAKCSLWEGSDAAAVVEVLVETIGLASYRFEAFKSQKKAGKIQEVGISVTDKSTLLPAVQEGNILATATNFARELVATPANVMTPVALAEQAKAKGEAYGFEVEVKGVEEIKALGMEAFWQVAKGSDNPPRLIIMRYNGDPANPDDITALVGKGICFDSGGLSLKSREGMIMMKTDMGGAAGVIGAMCAIAQQKLNANVVSIVAACENIPSAKSYKPGDIIGSMGGKTIHIGSTDAEGRLTLIDAVYYAVTKENATRVIDIATLTGSCVTALGTRVTGVVANNDDLYQRLEDASHITDEKVWRLPHFEEYKQLIQHPEADLNNTGKSKGAGTITAGLFIGEFVQDKPWVHMDIAGKAWSKEDLPYMHKGATGVGVRNLYYVVKSFC